MPPLLFFRRNRVGLRCCCPPAGRTLRSDRTVLPTHATKANPMAFWGLEVKPGKATPLNLERRLVIKQAALSVSKPSPEPVVLSVRPRPQCTLDGAHTRLPRHLP